MLKVLKNMRMLVFNIYIICTNVIHKLYVLKKFYIVFVQKHPWILLPINHIRYIPIINFKFYKYDLNEYMI